MLYEHLSVIVSDRIALLTITRPNKLNALSNALMRELDIAFAAMESDSHVGGIIITGAGKAFIAGADIGEITSLTPLAGRERCLRDQRILRRLEKLGKPSIAAINGYALGGGLELALCCSMRVAVRTVKLGLPEAKIGAFPANGGTQRLPRLIGRGLALEMMLTGKLIPAELAERYGLVNHVVEPDELLPFTRSLMSDILANSPVSLAAILDCVDLSDRCGLDEGLDYEAATFAGLASAGDLREGTSAFLEKRKPVFPGR